jgi:hypothetical protein
MTGTERGGQIRPEVVAPGLIAIRHATEEEAMNRPLFFTNLTLDRILLISQLIKPVVVPCVFRTSVFFLTLDRI